MQVLTPPDVRPPWRRHQRLAGRNAAREILRDLGKRMW
jgi:hypothetical protein